MQTQKFPKIEKLIGCVDKSAKFCALNIKFLNAAWKNFGVSVFTALYHCLNVMFGRRFRKQRCKISPSVGFVVWILEKPTLRFKKI